LRTFFGDGRRWGLEVRYVSDGDVLRGTGGALHHALDVGALDSAFFVVYGDSYLPIDYASVWRAFTACGKPGLMTVFRNAGRWDTSNVLFESGQVMLYDKRRQATTAEAMVHIDYGLSVLSTEAVARYVPPERTVDLGDTYNLMSLEGQLAGYEVFERFYEVGSPTGIQDLAAYLSAQRPGA
jgi:MurNAc alpha-1-phosphate uridylyltransferase